MYANAGFKRVTEYKDKDHPEVYREAAARDPEYLAGRNALISDLKREAVQLHATRERSANREIYYNKVNLQAPGFTPTRPVIAQAVYEMGAGGMPSRTPSLTSLVPSGYRTDEDAETLHQLDEIEKKSKP